MKVLICLTFLFVFLLTLTIFIELGWRYIEKDNKQRG